MDEMWPHLSCVGGQQRVTSLLHHQSLIWIDYVGDISVFRVIPTPSSLAFDMKMSDKHKSASPCAMQVKNWWKTISIEEKLDLISRLEKGEWIFDICHNVRCADISIHTSCGNADRITESTKSGTDVLVCAARVPQSCWNQQYQKLWIWVSYILIVLEINE
jgi:hypothetical protein